MTTHYLIRLGDSVATASTPEGARLAARTMERETGCTQGVRPLIVGPLAGHPLDSPYIARPKGSTR